MSDKKAVIKKVWAGPVEIMSVVKKEAGEYKGKSFPAKISVEFKNEQGQWIEGKFRLPFTHEKHKFDKQKWEDLLKAAGVTDPKKAQEIVGKRVALVVTPFFYEGKVLWNPAGYYNADLLKDPLEAALGDLGIGGTEDAQDDLGF